MTRSLEDCNFQLRIKFERLLGMCAEKGIPIQITRVSSTQAEQDKLVERGMTQTKRSMHSVIRLAKPFSHAIDFAIMKDGKPTQDAKATVPPDMVPEYVKVGEMARSLGLEWGGEWDIPDWGHVQLTREE